MLTKHIALVSKSKKFTAAQLSQTAAALQKQATRDLGPIWNIQATVDYFPDLKSVPLGYWPIVVADNINQPGAAGFHTDKHNQPFSLVQSDETWQLTCSHEMCEMLIDPYGNRLETAGSLMDGQGKVNYLVEVCDPCEDASFAYSVNGILMSDFYTPNYFDPQAVPGVRYSYTGAIAKPLDIKKNGYISWQDPVSKQWYQATFFGASLDIKALLGMKEYGSSLRSQVDKLTKNPNHYKAYKAAQKKHAVVQTGIFKSAESKSNDWDSEISKLTGSANEVMLAAAQPPAQANITVTFFVGGIADRLSATLNRQDNTQDVKIVGFNGGTMTFDNVSSNDLITIDGLCLGYATVVIDIPLNNNPLPSYPAGNILDFFTVK